MAQVLLATAITVTTAPEALAPCWSLRTQPLGCSWETEVQGGAVDARVTCSRT